MSPPALQCNLRINTQKLSGNKPCWSHTLFSEGEITHPFPRNFFFLSFILLVPFFCPLQDCRLPMMAPQQGKEGQRSVHPVGMCGRHEPTVLKHLGWPSIWGRKCQELCPTPLLCRSAVPSASQELLVQTETTKTTKYPAAAPDRPPCSLLVPVRHVTQGAKSWYLTSPSYLVSWYFTL